MSEAFGQTAEAVGGQRSPLTSMNGAVNGESGGVDDSAARLASCRGKGECGSAVGRRKSRERRGQTTSDNLAIVRDENQIRHSHV